MKGMQGIRQKTKTILMLCVRFTLHQISCFNPLINSKWASRDTNLRPCCSAVAAIQRSFSGMGRPMARRRSFACTIETSRFGVTIKYRVMADKFIYPLQICFAVMRLERTVIQFTDHDTGNKQFALPGKSIQHQIFSGKQGNNNVGVEQSPTIHCRLDQALRGPLGVLPVGFRHVLADRGVPPLEVALMGGDSLIFVKKFN